MADAKKTLFSTQNDNTSLFLPSESNDTRSLKNMYIPKNEQTIKKATKNLIFKSLKSTSY